MTDFENLAKRDENGNTAWDNAVKANDVEAQNAIKSHIEALAKDGNTEKLEELLLTGFNPDVLRENLTGHENVEALVLSIPAVLEKISKIHKAVHDGNISDLKSLLEEKKLALAKDVTGKNILHKAVILKNAEIVEYFVEEFKDSLNSTDSDSRTALHYAAAGDGAIFDLMKNAGADEALKDVNDKTPADYKTDSGALNLAEIAKNMDRIIASKRVPSRPTSSKKGSRPGSAVRTSRPGSAAKGQGSRPGSAATGQGSRPGSGANAKGVQAETPKTPSATPAKVPPPKPASFAEKKLRESDPFLQKNTPTPQTIDGKYIAQNMGSLLAAALAEIAEKRPWDPIEYLSHYLYKYHDNLMHDKKQKEMEERIMQQKAEEEEEKKRREQRRIERQKFLEAERQAKLAQEEEARKQKEQEELQKRAREQLQLAKPPDLASVREDPEDSIKDTHQEKDGEGRTKLHHAASSLSADDVVALLKEGYSLADRDETNQTARDIAEAGGKIEIVQAIDNYLGELFQKQEFSTIENMLLSGFDKIPDIPGKYGGGNEDIAEFYNSIPNYMAKIERVHKSVEEGEIRTVKQELDRKKMAIARDIHGRSPLHIAVLNERVGVVKYIVESFPSTVNCRDNLNRTPLHYANGVKNEEIIETLLAAKADATVKDAKQHDPSYYQENNEDIKALIEGSNDS